MVFDGFQWSSSPFIVLFSVFLDLQCWYNSVWPTDSLAYPPALCQNAYYIGFDIVSRQILVGIFFPYHIIILKWVGQHFPTNFLFSDFEFFVIRRPHSRGFRAESPKSENFEKIVIFDFEISIFDFCPLKPS